MRLNKFASSPRNKYKWAILIENIFNKILIPIKNHPLDLMSGYIQFWIYKSDTYQTKIQEINGLSQSLLLIVDKKPIKPFIDDIPPLIIFQRILWWRFSHFRIHY